MRHPVSKDSRVLEFCLILVSVGLAVLLYRIQGYKMVVLNLFYLPVVLTAFYLGRYRAGMLALFSVIGSSVVVVIHLDNLASDTSPLTMVLSVAVWGAVLGMTALLVGTLSDERLQKTCDLHDAYVGVVEVLSQYLQSAHPRLKARSIRVAELSQKVAQELRLSPQQVDDIRVAALLYDMATVEITAKVICRAVGTLEVDCGKPNQHTFQGKDLLLSLGSVLSGALPLLQHQDHGMLDGANANGKAFRPEASIGAQIIQLVRDFDALTAAEGGALLVSVTEALRELRAESRSRYGQNVISALEHVVKKSNGAPLEKLRIATT